MVHAVFLVFHYIVKASGNIFNMGSRKRVNSWPEYFENIYGSGKQF